MQVKRLAIVICDGTPLGVMSFALGVFDLAKHYGALPAIDLRVVAGEPGAVLSGGGLACPLPYDLGAVRDADLVVIADWRDPDEIPPQPLLEALRAAHAAGGRLAAMCSGAFILAAAGLLDGRPATTHWAQAGLLAGKYPAIDVRPDQLYVDDGDVLTAGGGAAGMDLGLHLLRAHFGASVAARIARYMVVPPQRSGGQAQYLETPLPTPDLADPVGETLAWALGRLDQPLAVGHLARRARMSRRHFDRRFREVTGTTPAPGSPISACCAPGNCWKKPGCQSRKWPGSAGFPVPLRSGRTFGASWARFQSRTGRRSPWTIPSCRDLAVNRLSVA